MKKAVRMLLLAVILLCSACSVPGWGTRHITDPAEYGKVEEFMPLPDYFPPSLDGYSVNSYSYTVYAYMDVCCEIFLDLTVTRGQLDELLARARSGAHTEQPADYAPGYYEIIYEDSCTLYPGSDFTPDPENIWNAKICKVIYHPEALHIVFEHLDAFDSGVYPIREVAYFNRFGIDYTQYAKSRS